MARGARSSRLKANKTKLRTNVFNGPIADRTARLSEKQQAKASEPLERKEAAMEVDGEVQPEEERNAKEDDAVASTAMDVDGDDAEGGRSKRRRKAPRTNIERRAERKLRHKKVRNMLTFPVKRKSTRRQPRI